MDREYGLHQLAPLHARGHSLPMRPAMRHISVSQPNKRLILAAVAGYALVFMVAGTLMGRPRAQALREFGRNEKLKAQAMALKRTNADLEREARYYQTDAGREELARGMGWVRQGETPIVFTK